MHSKPCKIWQYSSVATCQPGFEKAVLTAVRVQGEAVEDFTQLSRKRLEHTFNVNIIGMIRLAQEVVEHMPAGGSIINVSPTSERALHEQTCLLCSTCTCE